MIKRISNMADAAIWDQQLAKASSNPEYKREIKTYGYFLDAHQIMAKRIKNGEPVGEFWLKGRLKQQLLDQTDLRPNDFTKYSA